MPYELVRLKSGHWSVHSTSEGETFHPVIGPVAEAQALYVNQLRLTERIAACNSREFVIWDVGLGAGANSVTALRAVRLLDRRIRLVSFDCTMEPLRFALTHKERLGFLEGYETSVERLITHGYAAFEDGEAHIRWERIIGDFPTLLASSQAERWPSPDAILFDAYSPAKNPSMWSLPLFSRLHQVALEGPPCTLATYSRATLLRATLLLAGWNVGAGSATGEKEETTVAATVPELIERPLDRDWLRRAERSTSAEPLMTTGYRQAPLSPTNLARLKAHPQFR